MPRERARRGSHRLAADRRPVRRLLEFLPTPVVELNHAVAVGMARGPLAGLELVEALEASGKLAGYHLLPATRADFLRRLGRARKPPPPTPKRSSWPAPTPSVATCAAG